ncbi:hypothetical protein [Amycolatopsis sp. cg13]|uniref:hypothetical protein n=1 Tax=Amycolatopsis sp. cg13 TaxID=3238807 RepID=UPI003525A54F
MRVASCSGALDEAAGLKVIGEAAVEMETSGRVACCSGALLDGAAGLEVMGEAAAGRRGWLPIAAVGWLGVR